MSTIHDQKREAALQAALEYIDNGCPQTTREDMRRQIVGAIYGSIGSPNEEALKREYRTWAIEQLVDDDLEIDDDAVVSLGADEDGAFVQSWTWVNGRHSGILADDLDEVS